MIESTVFQKSTETDKNGNTTKTTTGTAFSTEYGYTAESAISVLSNVLKDVTLEYSYGYDKNGNITGETVTRKAKGTQGETLDTTENTAYTYDENGQLKVAENGTTKWEYTYDNRGNILTTKEYAVTVDENGDKVYTLLENGTDVYTYDETWKDKLTSYNGQSITYDVSGNPTNYMGTELSWTMGRQLASFGDISYLYNEDGIRTAKTSNGVTTKFYLDGTNVIEQTDGTNTLHFYYDSRDEVTGFKYNGNNYFYVKNAMGDILAIADSTGVVVTEYTYNPWGKVIDVTGSNVALGSLNPFRYRSYYYDSDIGMYYLQSRYYDPEICRFINCDDVHYIGVTESEVSYNPFAYCGNEPVNKKDEYGCYFVHNNYWNLGDGSYFINSTIYVDNRSRNIIYSYDNYVFSVSNYMASMETIVSRKWLEPLAFGMYEFAKYIDHQPLYGRSIKGIKFELLVHYIIFVALKDREKLTKTEKKHYKSAKITDVGSTKHDSNGSKFEKYKYLYPILEIRFLTNSQNAYAVYKFADKLGVLP